MKRLFLSITVAFQWGLCWAQVPTVTSFSPTSGPIGTTVTITGTNFNPTAASNRVYFGAIKVTPTAGNATSLTVVVPIGATSISPLVVQNTSTGLQASSVTSNTRWYTVTTSPAVPLIYTLSTTGSLGTGPISLTAKDFNNDGKTDLAVLNNGSTNVGIRIGNGLGGFTGSTTVAVGTDPRSVVSDDFNGDGNQDLAVVNGVGNVSIRLGNGLGGFSGSTTIPVGAESRFAATGDFDGDGDSDIAVANAFGGSVSILLGDGAGGFASGALVAAGFGTYAVGVADFNGDNKPDLAIANNSSNDVGIRLGDGLGGFSGSTSIPVGTNPRYIVLGDFNGDGATDLATANQTSNNVSVRLGDGLGGFSGSTALAVGANPLFVAIGDLNGDGNADLATANQGSNNVTIWLGDGLGGFTGSTTVAVGTGPFGVVLEDFNQDGKVDLSTANNGSNNVSVPQWTPPPTITSFTPGSGLNGTTVTITGTNFTGATAVGFGGTAAASFTVVSATSITAVVAAGASGNVSVTTPAGTASLAGFVFVPVPTISSFTPTSGAVGTTVTITGTNFSTTPANNLVYFGATRAQVITATATQLTVTSPGGSTYQPISLFTGGASARGNAPFITTFPSADPISACSFEPNSDITVNGPARVEFSDIDEDGKPDMIVSHGFNQISIYRNIGATGSLSSASFSAPLTLTVSGSLELAIDDLDGDGKRDIITHNQSFVNRIVVLRNTSTIGSISFAAQALFATGNVPYSVTTGDIDGDGRPELISANNSDGTISILKNNSSPGSLNFLPKFDVAVESNVFHVRTNDLDGDNKLDIIVGSSFDVSVFRNTSSVGFIGAGSLGAKVNFPGGGYNLFSDLDGDGKDEIIVSKFDGRLSILRNVSIPGTINTGSFQVMPDIIVGTSGGLASIGDVNGDNKPDLIRVVDGTKAVFLQNNSSTGSIAFLPKVDFPAPPNALSANFGDLDDDSRPDMVILKYLGTNKISLHKNIISPTSIVPVITSFTPEGGVAGNSVTISGSNFSPVAAENIVTFNGIPAAFLFVNPDGKLVAQVPSGVTQGPISVTVNCITGTSSTDFIANCSIPVDEKDALEDIYNAMDGPNWTNSTNWLSPDVRTWYGIYTNGCHVTGWLPAFDDPIGQLPAALGLLPELEQLSINSSRITGDLPAEIGNLTKLVSLSITGPVSGPLPSSIGNLAQLKYLWLQSTMLSGNLPTEIGNLASLESLTLSSNAFSGPLPASIGNLTNLKDVNLYSNAFSGPLPATLSNLVKLETLRLSSNQFSGTMPAGIGSLPLLTRLRIDFNQFDDIPVFTSPLTFQSDVAFNRLDFGDIEPNRPKIVTYAPQSVLPGGSVSGTVGLTLVIPFSTGGLSNQYQWYKDGILIPGATSMQYSKTNAQLADAGNYTIRITNPTAPALTLNSSTFVVTITVPACTPPLPPMANNQTMCGSGTFNLVATGATGSQEYRWYNVPIGGTVLTSAASYTTPLIAATTSYYVSLYEPSTSCEGSRKAVQAIVNSPPPPPAAPTVDGPSCSGSTFTFSTSGASPGEYRWYTVPTGGTPIAGATNDSYVTSLSTATNPPHFVSVFIGGCESGRQSVTATVIPLPAPPVPSNPAPVCTGSPSPLTASGTTNGNYRWYDGTSLITGEVNGTYITPALSSNRIFGVSIHDGTCESPIQTVVASVQTCSPPVVATQVTVPFIPGVIRIDLTPLLSDPENNLDITTLQIVSGLPSGATATIDGTDLVIDYGGMPFPGTETIVLKVCDLTGKCSDETTVTINLSTEIAVFNAISPNADGKNDVIFIENIDLLPETQQNKLTLFDRWGSVVFEAVNYNNTTNTFRGLGKNGEELPSGTYFYTIEFSGGAPKRTGFIALRK